jgi:hypothetical protein
MAQPIDREQLKTILYDAAKLKELDAKHTATGTAGVSTLPNTTMPMAAVRIAGALPSKKVVSIGGGGGGNGDGGGGGDGHQPMEVEEPNEGPDEDEMAALLEMQE